MPLTRATLKHKDTEKSKVLKEWKDTHYANIKINVMQLF